MQGICFKEPLVKATVKKRKTQTRRLAQPQPDFIDEGKPYCHTDFRIKAKSHVNEDGDLFFEVKPRYKVGEVLYLKEPYAYDMAKDENGKKVRFPIYKYSLGKTMYEEIIDQITKWKNKLFMPAAAARSFIKITAVRMEKLQDISVDDCYKEGIKEFLKGRLCDDGCHSRYGIDDWKWEDMFNTPREAYEALINQIDGKTTWERNPWVWVYDYYLCDVEGNAL